MQLVGRLTSKYHVPVVSPRDYVEGLEPPAGISTPVEGISDFKLAHVPSEILI